MLVSVSPGYKSKYSILKAFLVLVLVNQNN